MDCNLNAFNFENFNSNKTKSPSYEQFLLLTEMSVDFANEVVDKELGKIDVYSANDFFCQKQLDKEAMLTGLIYMERYKKRKLANSKLTSNSFTSADLFLVSMMLASKYLFDNGTKENVVNEEWAEDAGMETEDLNKLEVELLNELDWRLHVLQTEYVQFNGQLKANLALRHLMRHNVSTYLHLSVICENWHQLSHQLQMSLVLIIKMLISATVVYISILTMLHSIVAHLSVNNNCQPISSILSIIPQYQPVSSATESSLLSVTRSSSNSVNNLNVNIIQVNENRNENSTILINSQKSLGTIIDYDNNSSSSSSNNRNNQSHDNNNQLVTNHSNIVQIPNNILRIISSVCNQFQYILHVK